MNEAYNRLDQRKLINWKISQKKRSRDQKRGEIWKNRYIPLIDIHLIEVPEKDESKAEAIFTDLMAEN